MIATLILKAGPVPNSTATRLLATAATVIVGPNSSGKSLLLREVFGKAKQNSKVLTKVLDRIDLRPLTDIEANESLRFGIERHPEGHQTIKWSHGQSLIQQSDIQRLSIGSVPQNDPFYFALASRYVTMLDGGARLSMLGNAQSESLNVRQSTILGKLLVDDDQRQRFRDLVFDGIKLYPVIDPTGMQQYTCRLSTRAPSSISEERGIDKISCTFHSAAIPINEASDGVRAYCGLLASAIADEAKLLLVDEPEAFLHPPLADLLGRQLVRVMHESNGQLVAATHSSHFLKGCISSGLPISVLRLDFANGAASARVLAASELTPLMRDPLLRSSRVIDGLFARCAVVTEGDSDRAFYEEINVRLQGEREQGIHDAVFLNAQNKQTVARIVGLLRSMGVAAAAVVDLDILKQNDLTELMRACGVPATLLTGYGVTRGNLLKVFEEKRLNPNQHGVDALDPENRRACESFCNSLKQYGLFIVQRGPVEGWLKHLGAQGSKTNWLIDAFKKMGDDPGSSAYLKPCAGDVWDFVREIGNWASQWVPAE